MDADSEKSFELKSQFKIGGYPTIIMAKVGASGRLEEVGRVVGYYPPKEFYARLDQAYLHRNDTNEKRWEGRQEELLSLQLEQKNYDEIIKLTDKTNEPKLLIYRWIAEVKKNADFIKDEKNLTQVKSTIEELARNAVSAGGETIMNAVDFLNEEFWLKQKKYYQFFCFLYSSIVP